MRIEATSWEVKAAAKQAGTSAKIPPSWRLSAGDLQRAKNQRDLTGPFIRQFLPENVNIITSKDSLELVESLRRGDLTAVEVTTAFCKTAAVAHQIVGSKQFPYCSPASRSLTGLGQVEQLPSRDILRRGH